MPISLADIDPKSYRDRIVAKMCPPLTSQQVLHRSIARARGLADDLREGLHLLSVIGGETGAPITVPGDTLVWLGERFRRDAHDLITTLDHATSALNGRVKEDAHIRFSAE